MVRNPRQLTQQQIAVLRWIAEGSPGGRYESGFAHRISARALEGRGLVSISGKGDSWRAEITESGQAWLAGPHPEPPIELSEADALIQSVLDAGGTLSIEGHPRDETYRLLIRQSLKSPLRPHGQRLELRATGSWADRGWEITLVEYPDDFVDARPVPVPKQVRQYHPIVKAFLADKEWSFVSPDHTTRAAHLLQAIADEAERRGLEVLGATEVKRDKHEREHQHAHLVIQDEDARYSLRILEISASGAPKLAPRQWNAPKRLPSWRESRTHEFVSTGDLELRLYGPLTAYDDARYRDGKRARLEERLPELFRSLDIYRLKRAALARQRADEEVQRQRSWEAAMEHAKREFAEAYRVKSVERQAAAWRRARDLREYHDALTRVRGESESEPSDALGEWLRWIEQHIKQTDPLADIARLAPDVPAPSSQELVPFLRGLSPYGPAHH